MSHLFVTCYFNYCDYKVRYQLTKEFIERYPFVQLIEVAYGSDPFKFSDVPGVIQHRQERFTGWASNKYLNQFISSNPEALSITFIDSDCFLEPDFVDKVIEKVESVEGPYFIQPYKTMRYLFEENQVTPEVNGIVKDKIRPHHTGLAYTYNRALLDLICPLPESLVLGGYDTILYLILLNGDFNGFCNKIANKDIVQELYIFKSRFIGVRVDNCGGCIITGYHGDLQKRAYNTRLALYKDITESTIISYFESRKEDEPFMYV